MRLHPSAGCDDGRPEPDCFEAGIAARRGRRKSDLRTMLGHALIQGQLQFGVEPSLRGRRNLTEGGPAPASRPSAFCSPCLWLSGSGMARGDGFRAKSHAPTEPTLHPLHTVTLW